MGASQPSRPTGSIFLFVCISLFYVNRSNFHVSTHVSGMRKYSFVSPHEIRIFVIIIFFFLILAPDHHVTLSCRSHVRVGDTFRSAALVKHVSLATHNRIVFVYWTARLDHGSRTGQDGVLVYQTTRVPPHMYFTMFTYRAGWRIGILDSYAPM